MPKPKPGFETLQQDEDVGMTQQACDCDTDCDCHDCDYNCQENY